MQILISVMMGTTSLANASPNFETIASAWSGAIEIFKVIDSGSPIDNFSEEGERPENVVGDISFQDVSFVYPSAPEKVVLKSLNLSAKRGQTVALVGHSGCGKSTTVQMLLRFYDAASGTVSIDGRNVQSLNVRWLRKHIGLVSQEPVLFNCSIKDNIKLGLVDEEDVSDEVIADACRLANAHDFISNLPEGYNTLVGERGAQLSGGQKQRIAIARALVKNPKILLLDEATSALDTTSEKVVQEALDRASVGRTTLVIAHRLSTIRNADSIAVVNNGVVEELGDHHTLLEKGGIYSQLVKTQEVADHENEEKQKWEAKAEMVVVDETDEKEAVPAKISDVAMVSRDDFEMDVEGKGKGKGKEKKEKPPSKMQMLRVVLGWGRPELKFTIACIFVSVIWAAIQPGFSILLSEFIGEFCPIKDTTDHFNMLIGVIIGLGALQAICITLQHYLFSVIGERLTTRMRERLLGKFLRMDAKWLDRRENQPAVLTTMLATDCIEIQGVSTLKTLKE